MTYLTRKTIYQGRQSGTGGGGGGGTPAFNGNRAITRDVIGLDGVTPGGTDIVTVLNNVLYPPLPPTSSLEVVGDNPREVGESTAYQLNWAVFKGTNNFVSIVVDGNTITPPAATKAAMLRANFPATRAEPIPKAWLPPMPPA